MEQKNKKIEVYNIIHDDHFILFQPYISKRRHPSIFQIGAEKVSRFIAIALLIKDTLTHTAVRSFHRAQSIAMKINTARMKAERHWSR